MFENPNDQIWKFYEEDLGNEKKGFEIKMTKYRSVNFKWIQKFRFE